MSTFPKARKYLLSLPDAGDELDRMAARLVGNDVDANRVRKALDERFNKGAKEVRGIDRGGRETLIKRVGETGSRKYLILGTDSKWHEPEEKIWALAMFELGRQN